MRTRDACVETVARAPARGQCCALGLHAIPDAMVNLAPGLGISVAELFAEQNSYLGHNSRADYTHQGC
jgi:hypothetical protein